MLENVCHLLVSLIENITKHRAIIYGGLINDGDVTSTVYIIDIRKKAIVSYD